MPARLPVRASNLQALRFCCAGRQEARTFFAARAFQPLTRKQTASDPISHLDGYRSFTSTAILAKKGGKAKGGGKNKKGAEHDVEEDEDTHNADAAADPYDFATLEDAIAKCHEKLKLSLSKLRPGGRFNPEVLEALRVHPTKDSAQTVRLGELGQVLPKGGRQVIILVNEQSYLKPIISAIQGSKELNLQPQVDAHNALQLNLTIPPPTKESRDQAVQAVLKAGEAARVAVRNARADTHKKLRNMEVKKLARPDDLRKAHTQMEKLVEKAVADIKTITDNGKKTMEQ